MKPKTCKNCKISFTPERPMMSTCSLICAIVYSRRPKPKAQNKEKKEFNESDKTVLKEKAQRLINRYARLRDYYDRGYKCCTCGHTTGQMDGGHFLPTSTYSAIRYNTNQIHQQCKKCNRFNGGMRNEYRAFMLQKYGDSYVDSLESFKGVRRRYDVAYYQKLIRVVSKKIKIIEHKLKELQNGISKNKRNIQTHTRC